MTSNDRYFPALTGFRAIAAWLVFAAHYNPFSAERFGRFLSGVVNEGYIGVSLFFVLSGFLITIRYDDPRLPKLTFGSYMQNRFARIYPLYFLMTTLTFFVAGQWGWVYIANITFLKGFFEDLKFTGIAQGWSLTTEETFYILAPLIFIAMRNVRFATWLLPFLFLIIIFVGPIDFMLMYTFFGRAFDFFAGIWLAKIYQNKRRATVHKQIFTWIGILGIFVCLILLFYLRAAASPASMLVHHLLVPTTSAMLLWGLLTESSFVSKFLSTRFMQLMGKTSYAFYLIHLGVIALWITDVITGNVIVLFILLNLAATALFYSIEQPLRHLLRVKQD